MQQELYSDAVVPARATVGQQAYARLPTGLKAYKGEVTQFAFLRGTTLSKGENTLKGCAAMAKALRLHLRTSSSKASCSPVHSWGKNVRGGD